MIGAVAADGASWLEFFGRLHVVLLHLPIGLVAASVLVELAAVRWPDLPAGLRRGAHLALAGTAVLAAGSGWVLGRADYAGELVDEHRRLGLIVAGLAVALAAVAGLAPRMHRTRRSILALVCVAVVAAALHKGSLTHGERFLAEPAPVWLAGLLVEERDADPEALELPGLPLAALEARCFACHSAAKVKGGLRLDTLEGLLSVVTPGLPAESELLARVRLPASDEQAMPPKGARLAAETIDELAAWVASGAPVGDAGAALAEAEARGLAAEQLLASVRADSGAHIEPIALDLEAPPAARRFAVEWSHAGSAPEPEQLAALAPIAERCVELGLAGLELRGGDLAALPELPGLERVHLERSAVGDEDVRLLAARASGLRYLNLHSTGVTADALTAARGLVHLEDLIVFGTAIEDADVEAFLEARPNVAVTRAGAALPTNAADPFLARPPRRILAADASVGRIALLREITIGHPELIWEHAISELHDLQWLGDTTGGHGRVLFQDSWTRLLEVDTATGEVLWSYDAAAAGEGPVEVHSFRRLENGDTLVAESGRARLVVVDPDGELRREILLTVDEPSLHHDTRLVRPTPAGTFLVAHEREGVVREIDEDGEVVWEYDVPLFDRPAAPGHGPEAHGDQVFAAVRLADGDTAITTGNGSSLLRVRPSGSLRWHLGQDDLHGVRLGWTTTVQELSNGNLVLGNCHAGPDQPQAVELTAEGELVWSFRDHELFGNSLSNFAIIEAAP